MLSTGVDASVSYSAVVRMFDRAQAALRKKDFRNREEKLGKPAGAAHFGVF